MGVASPTHLIVVVVIIVLLFGAKSIPKLARGLGSGLRELQRGVSGMEDERGYAAPKEEEPRTR